LYAYLLKYNRLTDMDNCIRIYMLTTPRF
jgi:hypothetical protein